MLLTLRLFKHASLLYLCTFPDPQLLNAYN